MSAAQIWNNVLAYSLQMLALIAAGAAMPWLFRMRHPRARQMYWQILLIACLLLPLQPWTRPVLDLPAISEESLPDAAFSAATPAARPALGTPAVALAIIGAGILLRAIWLAAGFLRLARYRAKARPLGVEQRMGAAALVCLSEEIPGPVTFGWLNPVVLLPSRCLDLPERAREAILCHEFLHVRRRDWLASVAEEIAGALFWFHPALWWLLAQARLAREQSVDHAVVAYTRAREHYVEALLAVAASPRLDLAPAPLFLKKRHLVRRVGSLFQEVSMSKRHLAASFAAVTLILAATAWLAVSSFPLQAAPQARTPDAAGVNVAAAQPRLLHREPVQYPPEAKRSGVQGSVVLEITISESGEVSDARVVSGPEELRKAALESVLKWHFANDAKLAVKSQVTINFRLAEDAAPAPPAREPRQARTIAGGTLPGGDQVLVRLKLDSLQPALADQIRPRLEPFLNRPLDTQTRTAIAEAIFDVDRHLGAIWRSDAATNQVSLELTLEGSAAAEADFPSTGEKRVRVGGNAQQQKLVEQQRPVYPPLAKQARIQGVVRMNALIAKDGHVANLQVASGHPLLIESAVAAVRNWVYQPTLLNGEPVEVITVIDVNFTLSQ